MIKALIDYTENELREEIAKVYTQWQSAENRVDKFGSIKCQGQAGKYLKKYQDLLHIAALNEFKLTEKEIEVYKHRSFCILRNK